MAKVVDFPNFDIQYLANRMSDSQGIVLSYFGWLLVVLGGWNEKKSKNRFKSKKSDLNQINLIFLIF